MLNDRQREALRLVHRDGSVRNRDLRRRFAVCAEAIRQDLEALCDAGLLEKVGRCSGTRYVVPGGPTPPIVVKGYADALVAALEGLSSEQAAGWVIYILEKMGARRPIDMPEILDGVQAAVVIREERGIW